MRQKANGLDAMAGWCSGPAREEKSGMEWGRGRCPKPARQPGSRPTEHPCTHQGLRTMQTAANALSRPHSSILPTDCVSQPMPRHASLARLIPSLPAALKGLWHAQPLSGSLEAGCRHSILTANMPSPSESFKGWGGLDDCSVGKKYLRQAGSRACLVLLFLGPQQSSIHHPTLLSTYLMRLRLFNQNLLRYPQLCYGP